MARPAKNGAYVVPSEIIALKPAGISCTVKAITTKNAERPVVHYYVYEVLSAPDPKHPARQKFKSGQCIGKIEGGTFCPNKAGIQKLNGNAGKEEHNDSKPVVSEAVETGGLSAKAKENLSNTHLNLADIDLQIKDYGEYAVVLASTTSVLERLNRYFSTSDSRLIYALSIIYFIEEYTPASYVKDIFDRSILSNKWPSLAISENYVSSFLKLLGQHPLTCADYAQGLINDGSGMTAIDGHVILSCSEQNELADYGNKYSRIANKQLNILEAYDVSNDMPLTSKAYEGGLLDKTSVQDLFSEYEFPSKTVFLVDMGFYSEENLGLYRADGKQFIIPLPDNAVISKAMCSAITFTGSFVYKKKDENGVSHDDIILYRETTVEVLENLYQQVLEEETRRKNEAAEQNSKPGEKPKKYYTRKLARSAYGKDRVIMFRDEDMHNKMVSEFLSQLGTDEAHTEARLKELSPGFGLILLRTNQPEENKPCKVYSNYKQRWKVETHYNFIENTIRFYGLKTSDYYSMQGLSFLMLTVGQVKAEFVRKMKSSVSPYVNHLSIRECLAKTSRYKLSQHRDHTWHVAISTKKNTLLMKELGVDIADDVQKLNAGVY